MEEIIQEGSQPDPGVTPLKFDTVYARSLLQQYRICLWKFNITYWRTPNYNATRFSFSIAVALIFGACFWKLGGKTGNEQQVRTPKPCHHQVPETWVRHAESRDVNSVKGQLLNPPRTLPPVTSHSCSLA